MLTNNWPSIAKSLRESVTPGLVSKQYEKNNNKVKNVFSAFRIFVEYHL